MIGKDFRKLKVYFFLRIDAVFLKGSSSKGLHCGF